MKTALASALMLASPMLCTVLDASVDRFILAREAQYVQSDATTVSLDSGNPFEAFCDIKETPGTSNFRAAYIQTPNDAAPELMQLSTNGGWYVDSDYGTLAELEAAIPYGTYSVTLVEPSVSGTQYQFSFDFTSGDFPSAPVISNFAALNPVADAASEITISWDAWTGGTGNDFILVSIENVVGYEVFTTALLEEGGALDHTATSVSIPAGTLKAGMHYTAYVSFIAVHEYVASGTVPAYADTPKICVSMSTTELPIYCDGTADLASMLSAHVLNESSIRVTRADGNVFPDLSSSNYSSFQGLDFIKYSEDPSAESSVFFSGPVGTGLDLSEETRHMTGGDFYRALYFMPASAAYLPNGTYSVRSGTDTFSGTINYMPSDADDIVVVPTIACVDGRITGITWEYYDISSQSAVPASSLPEGSTVSVNATMRTQNGNGNSIMMRYIPVERTSLADYSSTFSIFDLQSIIFDLLVGENNDGFPVLRETYYAVDTEHANIFNSLSHYELTDWIVPYADSDSQSWGMLYDGLYPYVYSPSLDKLANGGTYTGSTDGWMYVYPWGSMADGFYYYSYATDKWYWTNYYWGGTVYDYSANEGTGGWIDVTP
ncbi:MAG: hypothetical protein JW942_08240 [Opitutales bacterium]|nr:hypothetical protein [Opitutales bacterium]